MVASRSVAFLAIAGDAPKAMPKRPLAPAVDECWRRGIGDQRLPGHGRGDRRHCPRISRGSGAHRHRAGSTLAPGHPCEGCVRQRRVRGAGRRCGTGPCRGGPTLEGALREARRLPGDGALRELRSKRRERLGTGRARALFRRRARRGGRRWPGPAAGLLPAERADAPLQRCSRVRGVRHRKRGGERGHGAWFTAVPRPIEICRDRQGGD